MFDLSLLPFPISSPGSPLYPGFLVIQPPRKPARGRENDILILYFKLHGKSNITGTGLKAWLENKAAIYHHNSGTVTSGIRSIFEEINQDLIERNSRFAKENGQVSGSLKVMVLKKDILYVAVCGAGSAIQVTGNEVQYVIDDEDSGRGLGFKQKMNVRFNQTNVKNGDLLFFVNDPPDFWTDDQFSGGPSLTNEAVYRRLFSAGIGDAQGVMVRFREGDGKLTMIKMHSGERVIAGMPPVQEAGKETPASSAAVPPFTKQPDAKEDLRANRTTVKSGIAVPQAEPPDQSEKQPLILRRTDPQESRARRGQPQYEEAPAAAAEPEQARQAEKRPQAEANIPWPKTGDVKAAVGGVLRKGAAATGKTESWVKSTLQKILPGPADQPLSFSKAVLVFIAVAVPVIIVAIAASLYIRNGRSSLFDGYMAEAQLLATQAASQTDASTRQSDLKQSLYWLEKADEYGSSDDSTALRQSVQSQLDDLEGVTRIDMVSAIGGVLPTGTSISQLVVTGTDLYALDSNTGTVLRFFLSGSEYQQDSAFDCGPSKNSSLSVIGNLVDMVPISTDNGYGASLLAVDAHGKLEYCVAGESGYIVSLAAPDMGWVSISSISISQGNLYVLDIRGNAVYRFEGSEYEFLGAPTLFFDNEIPSLTQAVDIEVVGYELYILRSDGEMVECTYSPLKDMKSTECKDPAAYNDNRSGENVTTTTFPGTSFSQMRITLSPDSSLYLLDSTETAIYHLSYARNLQGVMYPRMADGESIDKYTPTAFTVSSNRQVFMAFGGLIYYGQMP